MAFKFLLVLVLAALATGQNKLMYDMDQKSPYVLGDIRLADWQLEETKGVIVNFPVMYWPGGKIPYYISLEFSATELVIIQEALAYYNLNTCIQFVPWTPLDKNYIHIIKEDGCYSYIGMVGGEQTLSLKTGCIQLAIILHELGHTIGLLHEHNRSDRDKYVEILWKNIPEEWRGLYQKQDRRDERICNKAYDCNSIMHYPPHVPQSAKLAMTARFPNCTFNDSWDHLTELDIEAIACAYCRGKPRRPFKD